MRIRYLCTDANLFPFIPRGVPALVFTLNAQDEHSFTIDSPSSSNYHHPDVYFFGQTSFVSWVRTTGYWDMIMAVLKPNGLYYVLRESVSQLANQFVPLSHWYPKSLLLTEQLAEQKEFSHQLYLIEQFLLKLVNRNSSPQSVVEGALSQILGSSGGIEIEKIARQERVSARTLHRKFADQVGLSPKAFTKIIRFRSLMQYVLSNPQTSWIDLTYRFNYYEQAHLIKDFYHFTGNAPMQYLSNNQELDNQLLIKL